MNSSSPSPLPGRSRGSVLLTVIIFTTVMALLAGSIVAWSLTERKLNTRTVYWLEARNAAEALCEYGASQIYYTNTNFDTPPSLNPDPSIGITDTNVPLKLPVIPPGTPSSNSFFNPNSSNGLPRSNSMESHIDTNPLSTDDYYGLELIGGQGVQVNDTSGSGLFYIDPNIPENEYDPFKGLQVQRTDYMVLAKTTAVPPGGLPPISAFVTETVSVRAAPLFNFAIFYGSNDLEIYPGANMIVTGPVHTNGNMFLNATSGATLSFDGTVSTTGNIYHAMESKNTAQAAMTDDNIFFAQTITPFNPVSMYDGTTWDDSTMGQSKGVVGTDTTGTVPTLAVDAANTTGQTFTKYAKTTWPGNVLTQNMGVLNFSPVGFNLPLQSGTDFGGNAANSYRPDSPYVDSGDQATVANAITKDTHTYTDPASQKLVTQAGNVSYINDPPDADFDVNAPTKDQYYLARSGLEGKKYANLANLYVLVVVTPGSAGAADQAWITYYGPYDQGNLKTLGYGPNGGVLMGTAFYAIPAYKTIAGTTPATTDVEPYSLISFVPYKLDTDGKSVLQGLYDQREGKSVDLVQLDVHALNMALTEVNNAILAKAAPGAAPPDSKTAIINLNGPSSTAPQNNIWGAGQTSIYNWSDNTGGKRLNQQTNGGWNGIVYVDIEWNGTPPANTEVALGIGNAETHTTGATIGANTVSNLANMEPPAFSTINLIPNNPAALSNGPPKVNDSCVGINWKNPYKNYGQAAKGLSIATNAPVYIEGNFNADGYIDTNTPPAATPVAPVTGGPQLPDDETSYANGKWSTDPTKTAEVPVAIVGDAVTILSPCYFGGDIGSGDGNPPNTFVFPVGDTSAPNPNPIDGQAPIENQKHYPDGSASTAYNSKITANPNSKTTAELATAIIAGIRVTDSTGAPGGGGSASGGANNLPRFIENWKNHALCIRGSMVNLYSSKFGTGRFHGNDNRFTPSQFFNPPDRHWGWANLFESGVFPPGTPVAYSVRRMYFNDLPADIPVPIPAPKKGDAPYSYTEARTDATWGWPGEKFTSVTGP